MPPPQKKIPSICNKQYGWRWNQDSESLGNKWGLLSKLLVIVQCLFYACLPGVCGDAGCSFLSGASKGTWVETGCRPQAPEPWGCTTAVHLCIYSSVSWTQYAGPRAGESLPVSLSWASPLPWTHCCRDQQHHLCWRIPATAAAEHWFDIYSRFVNIERVACTNQPSLGH